mmetsp:Transcript_71176/g.123501  ORF Transcript_71176/g.123501 Transcript_71176/m.123501 type:complete len:193 (+) Transcript_71176:78-656(+)
MDVWRNSRTDVDHPDTHRDDEEHETSDLYQAVMMNKRGSVQRHIRGGADLEKRNNVGFTALHAALKYADEDIAFEVIRAGADINARSAEDGLTPLLFAAIEGKDGVVRQLLSQGADVNGTDYKGNTALHMAAGAMGPCRESTILLLLGAGADLNIENHTGYTPVGVAEDMGGPAVSELLQSKGGTRASVSWR